MKKEDLKRRNFGQLGYFFNADDVLEVLRGMDADYRELLNKELSKEATILNLELVIKSLKAHK